VEPAYHLEYAHAVHEAHWWFQGRRRILETLMGPPSPSRNPALRILDLGSGPGRPWTAAWGRVLSLDRHEAALAQKGPSICADALHLPLKTGSMDWVCAFDVLEHLDDDAGALAEMVRVCRPGGRIWITVPALPWLWSEHDRANRHRRRYTASTLRRLLAPSGCRPLRMSYFNTLLLLPAAGLRLWDRLKPRSATPRSDLGAGGVHGHLLEALFAWERHPLKHMNLPIGLSLFAALETPCSPRPA